jgi:hypothetical protein
LSPLPWRTSTEPRRSSRSRSPSANASPILSPARHKITINARARSPWVVVPAWRITATISSTLGGSAG